MINRCDKVRVKVMKQCKKCKIEKEDNCFNNGRNKCKVCKNEDVKSWKAKNKDRDKNSNKQYRIENKKEIQQRRAEWYSNNKESLVEDQKKYYDENKEKIKERVKKWKSDNSVHTSNWNAKYREENKVHITKRKKEYDVNRRKKDPAYKLRRDISSFINLIFRRRGSSKLGKSITKFLPYSIQDLKDHLEKQFEPWMTWQNRGIYNAKLWDDNDSSTWSWQIDHIIPNSTFEYLSMEDYAFKECWALNNLRPLSARQNVLDGAKRTRHGGSNV